MHHPGGKGHGGSGHTKKHAKHVKHVHGKGKKHHPKHHHQGHHQQQGTGGGFVHTVAAGHAKHPRGLAVGDALPVCTFEALAASLRLLGQRVSDDDVAELWWLSGAREVSIAEALEAAARFGLAGIGPGRVRPVRLPPFSAVAIRPDYRQVYGAVQAPQHIPAYDGLLLGVDLPGPHAVLATPDGWWSWGELWSPWTSAVSEAWAVSWLS